ncbi:MAG: hypothetical protein QUV05_03015 [Phycisphaerae bacterium]|nr:hypothetical protein [Phycisphaerae bacterium]
MRPVDNDLELDTMQPRQAFFALQQEWLVAGDFDYDQDVDQSDFSLFQACLSGIGATASDPACQEADFNGDRDVDQSDLELFEKCASGPGIPAVAGCLRVD